MMVIFWHDGLAFWMLVAPNVPLLVLSAVVYVLTYSLPLRRSRRRKAEPC